MKRRASRGGGRQLQNITRTACYPICYRTRWHAVGRERTEHDFRTGKARQSGTFWHVSIRTGTAAIEYQARCRKPPDRRPVFPDQVCAADRQPAPRGFLAPETLSLKVVLASQPGQGQRARAWAIVARITSATCGRDEMSMVALGHRSAGVGEVRRDHGRRRSRPQQTGDGCVAQDMEAGRRADPRATAELRLVV